LPFFSNNQAEGRTTVNKKKWETPSGVEMRARQLTDDEVRKWRDDIEAILVAMEKRWAKSRGSERDYQLLSALIMCGVSRPLPDWLYKTLVELLRQRVGQKLPPAKFMRWQLMRYALDDLKLKWDEAPEWVSDALANTHARARPDTIRKDYEAWEKSLPPERRRPITHRRRS
jgi:hypothetical protein